MTRTILVIFALLSAAPAFAADLLVRASSQATAALGLWQLGMKPSSSAVFQWPPGLIGPGNYPYLQGTTAQGLSWFCVIAGGGSGQLFNAGLAYDSGFWMIMRWNGPLGTPFLNANLVAYSVNGVAVTTALDTYNVTPQTPVQPPAAVIATATNIM